MKEGVVIGEEEDEEVNGEGMNGVSDDQVDEEGEDDEIGVVGG